MIDGVTRLPSLGPRGEGWVVAQFVLLGAVALAGRLGSAWSGPALWATRVLGAAVLLSGVLLLVRGSRDLGSSLTPLPRPPEDGRLVDTGIYRRVRHPIYGGLIIAVSGWGVLTASPVAIALVPVMAAFFWFKSRREEAWLTERYPGYEAYRRRTRRFLPGLW
jgi:protein-S-isoprenylcysteine O-methyltransferase Ste14